MRMLLGSVNRQPSRRRLRLITSASGRHKQKPMAETGGAVNVLDVPGIETNLDAVAFIRLGGAAPERLFFVRYGQRKEQAGFIPTDAEFVGQSAFAVVFFELTQIRQLIGFLQIIGLGRNIFAGKTKPIQK